MARRVLNNRYELVEKLGEGGMAIVYRAIDRESGEEVALKAMKSRLDATSHKRFVREFRTVSSVQHPNCLRVLEFGETHDYPFFTMELFSGSPITTLHGRPFSTVFEGLYQAARAINFIHERGIVHRDVKPSNLLVRVRSEQAADEPSVDVKLTDFGLARFCTKPSTISWNTGFVGTLRYCAPEQLANTAVGHHVDLYAFGLVCYEILTGQYPFANALEDGIQSLVRAQLTQDLAPVRRYAPGVPPELEEAIAELLSKEPADRPESTGPLIHVLAGYLGYSDPQPVEPKPGRFVTSECAKPRMVGREQELISMRRVLHQGLSPHSVSLEQWRAHPIPSVLFIRGEAGIGKSRLLQEVLRAAQEHGASTYCGRCFEGNLAPYQPFVEFLQQVLVEVQHSAARKTPAIVGQPVSSASVSSYGLSSSGLSTSGGLATSVAPGRVSRDAAVKALVDDFRPEILRIAPDLRKWLPGEAFKQMDLNRETNYVLRALAALFVELGTLHGICLSIEDLQWADQGTLDLLRHLASALFRARELSIDSNFSYPRLFICCTARPGDERLDRFVNDFQLERRSQVLDLRPLSSDEIRELVHALCGDASAKVLEPLTEPLHRWCQGNPFFACEMVQGWMAQGGIVRAQGRWEIAADLDDSTCLPESVRDIWKGRIGTLSPAAGQLLRVASVIGTVVEVALLREACREVSEVEFLDGLDELLVTKTVVESNDGDHLEFAHDSIREYVYEQLSTNRRRVLHGWVGEALEQRVRGGIHCPPDLLANHFFAARFEPQAFHYLVEAAQTAIDAYAVDDAIGYLARALEILPAQVPDAQKFRLHRMRAISFGAAGKPNEAIAAYESCIGLTDDPAVQAEILGEIGELHFRVGGFDRAIEYFDDGLEKLDYRRPRWLVAALVNIVSSYTSHLRPRWLRLPRAMSAKRRSSAARACVIMYRSTHLWAQRSLIRCTQAHLHHLVLAEKLRDDDALAESYAGHAFFLGLFSMNRPAVRAAELAMSYSSRTSGPYHLHVAKGALGCVHYYGARLSEGERLLRESVSFLDRKGDSWLRQFFYHNLRHLYAILGDTENEIACARVEIEIGEAVQDPEGKCWGAYGVANALARSGDTDEAFDYMRCAMSDLSQTNIIVAPTALHTNAFIHLQAGNYEVAREMLEKSRTMIEENWSYVDFTIRAYPLLVESMLGPHWHSAEQELDRRVLRQAWRLAKRAVFWGRRFPNYLPHAYRALGRAAVARGKTQKALRYLSKAISHAELIGAKYDLARSYIDRAKAGGDQRQADEERGRKILSEIGAVVPHAEL